MKLFRISWRGTDFPAKEITSVLKKNPELGRGLCMRVEWDGVETNSSQVAYFCPLEKDSARLVELSKAWKPDVSGFVDFDPKVFALREEPFFVGLKDSDAVIGQVLK